MQRVDGGLPRHPMLLSAPRRQGRPAAGLVANTCTSTVCPPTASPPQTPSAAPQRQCDVAENRAPDGPNCPAAGAVCKSLSARVRPVSGCAGSSSIFPTDAKSPSGTICRVGSHVCDVAEGCGESAAGSGPEVEGWGSGRGRRPAEGPARAQPGCLGVTPRKERHFVTLAGRGQDQDASEEAAVRGASAGRPRGFNIAWSRWPGLRPPPRPVRPAA